MAWMVHSSGTTASTVYSRPMRGLGPSTSLVVTALALFERGADCLVRGFFFEDAFADFLARFMITIRDSEWRSTQTCAGDRGSCG